MKLCISQSRIGKVFETIFSIIWMLIFSPVAVLWLIGQGANVVMEFGEDVDCKVAHKIAEKFD